MQRTINFQTISWFWDLYNRKLLELDPPYQRRSVWNQEYKDFFVDTVLNGYPAPAIFIYQEITPEGISKVSIVDGKQRLSSLFEFANNEFPVYEKATIERFRGKYFNDLDTETKQNFWKYQFAIEYVPSSNEEIISNIFDRINRNVIKLTSQELRHAKFSGDFISTVEELTIWMFDYLGGNFPAIDRRSKKQMKDVEMVAQLLLFLEEGVKAYSQEYLDKAFSERDNNWEEKEKTENEFRNTIKYIKEILDLSQNINLSKTRLKNQADFYSLFGAIAELNREEDNFILTQDVGIRINDFLKLVGDADLKEESKDSLTDHQLNALDYYTAVKFSFTDARARKTRIAIMKSVIKGNFN
ncbi:DUF262 domain-containing protein [Gloeocapsopsis dulcis]|uniref:GmrSD restriction endonucleases N-terminal domain-containing protein n=1 Tax=Gloeocapsopsis dulcis AAB1 = 1H9 TaxID=1433147 RepID=A0A6N8G464_9CHRO|nr:DUF262 domain-containing protein [Gloeocapsopsis dulcis]MUL38957.1 hypothetical protein [Gloeocapsopsis dulcis AAB1 = 1H9]WNN89550.1 DUF262 domain-containing protein [Gloeocapsopsis dulcis]